MKDRLFELRAELKLSQNVFGNKLGITRSSVSNMETGRFNITEPMIKLICSTFNVNDVWLRTGVGEMFNVDQDHELAYMMGALFAEGNEFKMKFITQMLKLDDDIWAEIKSFIKKTAEDMEKLK